MPRTKLDTSAKGRTDWERLRAMPGAEVERIAAEDEDNPATDESHWANATIGVPPLKVPVNAKFDRDVVDWFKRQGRGYQTRMNAVLRKYMETQSKKAG